MSPAQLARFESYGHFEVIGSRTGKRYRIRHNRVVNIEELDERGVQVATNAATLGCREKMMSGASATNSTAPLRSRSTSSSPQRVSIRIDLARVTKKAPA